MILTGTIQIAGSQMGLPVAPGNEWNTGGGYQYSHAPFGGAVTPGSNFPEPFVPYGGGYQEPVYLPTGGAPTYVPPPEQPVTSASTTNTDTGPGGVRTLKGHLQGTSIAGTAPLDPAASTAVDTGDIIGNAIAWAEAHPVTAGLFVTIVGGTVLYVLVGGKN